MAPTGYPLQHSPRCQRWLNLCRRSGTAAYLDGCQDRQLGRHPPHRQTNRSQCPVVQRPVHHGAICRCARGGSSTLRTARAANAGRIPTLLEFKSRLLLRRVGWAGGERCHPTTESNFCSVSTIATSDRRGGAAVLSTAAGRGE